MQRWYFSVCEYKMLGFVTTGKNRVLRSFAWELSIHGFARMKILRTHKKWRHMSGFWQRLNESTADVKRLKFKIFTASLNSTCLRIALLIWMKMTCTCVSLQPISNAEIVWLRVEIRFMFCRDSVTILDHEYIYCYKMCMHSKWRSKQSSYFSNVYTINQPSYSRMDLAFDGKACIFFFARNNSHSS